MDFSRYFVDFTGYRRNLWMALRESLNCPHNEMKLKQNSFKTVSKLFRNCFEIVLFQFYFVVRTVFGSAEPRLQIT